MKILVTGAGGVVGAPLAERLERQGFGVIRTGRRERAGDWLAWDMTQPLPAPEGGFQCVVHTAPLWLLPDNLEALAGCGVTRVVCFSSTSALTKTDSRSDSDRMLAESLNRAERNLWEAAAAFGLKATVLRPTMIYGYGRDANISVIAGFIRRYGFFPVAGAGKGKRQPVHADDLVEAVTAVLDNPVSFGRSYNLPGGETLSYRAMVTRIFQALGRRARILTLPTALYRLLLAAAARAGRGVNGAMADRMNQDLAFDPGPAKADFGYSPQDFLKHPERDLPLP